MPEDEKLNIYETDITKILKVINQINSEQDDPSANFESTFKDNKFQMILLGFKYMLTVYNKEEMSKLDMADLTKIYAFGMVAIAEKRKNMPVDYDELFNQISQENNSQ